MNVSTREYTYRDFKFNARFDTIYMYTIGMLRTKFNTLPY